MRSGQADAKAIFLEALDCQEADKLMRFLERACGSDTALRARVEELLRAHRDAGAFLGGQHDAGRDEPITERAGTVIGPYKLMEQIGEGGMGLVFVAEQQQPVRRKVAVKVIKPGMDTREVIARFEAERQALALMDHPNIARVLDAGATESGRPYFVMELVRGVGITEFSDDNRLTPRQRLELFVHVCLAVQHAHQKGIIHRDLKATNILVTLHDGTPVVKVIDFGVAKAIGQQLTDKTIYTRFTQMIGTPMYMSPEQAEMSGLDIDTRSDIYALGVLLYELLTGTTPFDNERLRTAAFDEMRRIIREEEPPKPSTRFQTLGHATTALSAKRRSDPTKLSHLFRGELDWIVMKALEKDRNRRYETASAFAMDVQRYLNDDPVQACPPTLGYRLGKIVRRNRSAALAATLIVLALVGGIIGTSWGMLRATNSEADAVREAQQKQEALTDKVAALAAAKHSEQDANDQLFLALLNQARTGRFSRQMGQRLDSLAALKKAALIRPDERLRDEAIAALALPDIRYAHTIPLASKVFAFDDLYRTCAVIVEQCDISMRKVPNNQEVRRIKTALKSTPTAIWLSPNGQFVAVLDAQASVYLWCVNDGKPLLPEVLHPCASLAFSPDSCQVAIAEEDWVSCFDLKKGQKGKRWHLPAKAHSLVFHPDNRKVAVGYADQKIASVYDSVQGSHVADLPVGPMQLAVVGWHPDGNRLAVAGSDTRIQIWDVTLKRKLAILEGHVEQVTALSFHPDGSLLASSSYDGVLRLWDPATGRRLMQLPLAAIPRFSGDGRWLGCHWRGGEQVQLLEVTACSEYRTIVSSWGAGIGAYYDGDISSDGRLLALGMGGSGDRLWDLGSGQELATLPSKSHCVLFEPDGRKLLTCGPTGLQRWPIQNGAKGHELSLGPPRVISLSVAPNRASCSPDGKTLVIVSEQDGAGLLLDLVTESTHGEPFAHAQAGFVAFSHDGQWVASCGWHSDRVRLWNAKSGKMIHEWVLGSMSRVFFTPDSRALIISRGDAFTFWDVQTLQPIRRLELDVALYPGHVAFSADGELMALEMAPGVIHLKEVATARTVAKLEDPHGDRAGWMAFTPDGTQLVVAAPYAKAIHVWDLRAIRERLKAIGLDWNWPEFGPAEPKARASALVKVKVLSCEIEQSIPTPEEKALQAIEHYRLEIKKHPDNPAACNSLAWLYLTAPGALRDLKAAIPLAEKAVLLAPENAHYRNTLGVAYYRAGRYQDAVGKLEQNLTRQDDKGLAFDLYFLAMSHHQLGETARARDYFTWAVRWTATQPGLSAAEREELNAFRAEAEEVLGIEKKK